jgi:benzoyl-CoA reductase/2-hydroxyglutaryl-CoA dehydratase subunit BcrC/BadD/HgdB
VNEKKNTVKRRVGWFCSYVPEELILAGGFESVRLQGRVETFQEVDAFIHSNFCLFLRNILESGLTNQYEDLDAIIFTNTCDGMRRLCEIWSHYVKTPSAYLLEVPKNKDENGVAFFSSQLMSLKNKLEKDFAGSISDERLRQAIDFMNSRRSKMTAIFSQQKKKPAPFKGSELYRLAVKEGRDPKEKTEMDIEGFVHQPVNNLKSSDCVPRLMILGNEGVTPAIFRLIEDCGAEAVIFDNCRGLNHYSGMVENVDEPLLDLARRYLLKPVCARMPGYQERIDRLKSQIDEYSIEGVIYSAVKFCDYSLFEAVPIENCLKKLAIPLLAIENDYIWSNTGQIRTRVEAFIEMVRG